MPSPLTDPALVLPRHTKVLLVLDVVESVRLMEQDEDDFVRRWHQFVQQTVQRLLPLHGGRLVKSLGDGLMLEFADAQSCIRAAFALQDISQQGNAGLDDSHRMHLRMGAHLADFVSDEHDIYGSGVNLTARIATLAGPGEIVVSAAVRDQMAVGLDADVEDLGQCHLKHVKEPVHAYFARPVGQGRVLHAREPAPSDFRPTIAVIPFEARSNEPEHFVIGELIADGVIAQLSRSPDIRVISRLSTTAFRGRTGAMPDVHVRLDASFVLSGSYVASGGKILVFAELADTRKDETVWADRVSGDIGDLLQAQSEILSSLASSTARALIDAKVQESLLQPMPRLDSSSLLLGGISMMHRSSLLDFDRSRKILEALQERHNRTAAPYAWLAKWYTMRVIRGLSDNPEKDTHLALEQTRRALDISPHSALALAVEGYARCQLLGEANQAQSCIDQAIDLNPNEPMAWLYKSVWSSMWGAAADAVVQAEHAARLSPIDPLKYFFDVILASSYSSNRDYAQSITVANRSLKSNRDHLPALRVLLGAQGESGLMEDARLTLKEILRIVPNFTVQGYIAMGSGNSPLRRRQVAVLRALGVPET